MVPAMIQIEIFVTLLVFSVKRAIMLWGHVVFSNQALLPIPLMIRSPSSEYIPTDV